ncbi:MAG: porphobilinogen deaminase [Herpetosiphonaceae bacterium]|nr:MAG: porphobilinogen deaminase [Herpetosiphonaceae bacterium]
MSDRLIIGTRGSKLALAQAESVRHMLLELHPELEVELQIIKTKGDVLIDRPLSAIGDKGLFVKEIEAALLAGQVDLAVHSCKDLPSMDPPGLVLAAFPRRADPRDALIARSARSLADLPLGARVGTSSLRRACQLRAFRPDLVVDMLRGNVDTRLRKLQEDGYDAIVLAVAGLQRLGLERVISEVLDPSVMLPAVAQGALAVQCRAGDERTIRLLAPLDHFPTRCAVLAERALLRRLEGGCQVPIGAYATLDEDAEQLVLRGMLGTPDGRMLVQGRRIGPPAAAEALGTELAEELLLRGGREILAMVAAKQATAQE